LKGQTGNGKRKKSNGRTNILLFDAGFGLRGEMNTTANFSSRAKTRLKNRGDFHLQPNSPCINSGNNNHWVSPSFAGRLPNDYYPS
jgi:hypothetical protein